MHSTEWALAKFSVSLSFSRTRRLSGLEKGRSRLGLSSLDDGQTILDSSKEKAHFTFLISMISSSLVSLYQKLPVKSQYPFCPFSTVIETVDSELGIWSTQINITFPTFLPPL